MAMTMTQKILAAHAGWEQVSPGQLIEARLDLILGNDITAPVAIDALAQNGITGLADPSRIALVMDHFTPNKDIQAATQCKVVRDFARQHQIENFFDVGKAGIEHALLPERGMTVPGDCIIGADSHTCTYGALGAFSTGVGSTDMAAGMAYGTAWFKVPAAIRIELTGTLPSGVSGKDAVLSLIGTLGVDGALYRSLEFSGPGVAALSMDDRFCIANMTVEAGAKNGIFPVDDVTRAYGKDRFLRPAREFSADPDAEYERTVTIDLSALVPVTAAPHLPSNVHPASEFSAVSVDQVVIGSCTNGRLSDMRAAAAILKGRKVADRVRCIVIPATRQVYLDCLREGLAEQFVAAGAVFSTPTCGPCLGGHMGVLADGERCISTTNRNFVGRMGHPGSEVYLASPQTAAASAVTGRITDPRTL